MRVSYVGAVLAAAVLAGCDSSTDATEVGELRTAIVSGGSQVAIAGAPRLPNAVIGQAQRVPLGASLVVGSGANASATVHGLANVVMCVGEDQLDLIPFSRCVNTDTAGNAKFTFSPTTKAGTYRAKINFTLGALESTIDSAVVVVQPDVFAKSPLVNTTWLGRSTPAEFPADVAQDKFNNPVPYRFVVVEEAYGETATDTVGHSILRAGIIKVFGKSVGQVLGTAAARTVVIDSITGPTQVNGFEASRICGYIQVVTAQGVSVTGVFVTSRDTSSNGQRSFLLSQTADLSKRTTCPT